MIRKLCRKAEFRTIGWQIEAEGKEYCLGTKQDKKGIARIPQDDPLRHLLLEHVQEAVINVARE
ncbi:hypothetical protein [Bradyrhizobium sp. CCBAU 11357]|uniref:hypothetical protein n=1 Tax=Bradyrhizobium sp. CCBAU 11357 TaxID=1630808 RepID=UPI0023038A25|nr:hypothetical protein [Bradyrhizobium sp. CCBAU 11357]